MDWGRNPASDIATLGGGDINSGSRHLAEMNNIEVAYTKQAQIPTFGNKCGHNPAIPTSFLPPISHGRRPPIIEKAKKKLASLYKNPLSAMAGQLSYNPYHRKNKDGSHRKVRSEMRDIIHNCVGEALLHYLDRRTMYIGFEYSPGEFHYMGINSIYKAIKESIKDQNLFKSITYERVRKAIKTFEDCGYLNIQLEKELLPNGDFISKPAKLQFNEKFFEDLDINYEELLSKTLLNEKRKADRHLLKVKSEEYKKTFREIRKDAKQARRSIQELIKATRNNKPINRNEKDFLIKEMPGIDRKREKTELYPEFISKLVRRPPK